MHSTIERSIVSVICAVSLGLATGAAQAAVCPNAPVLPASGGYFQYGDAQSYSLPILNYLATGSAVPNQGDPFYVPSGPGHIMDCVVIATGTNNNPVNTNFPGMDDAYQTPSGQGGNPNLSVRPYFSTGDVYYGPGNSTQPDAPNGPAVGDSNSTWDSTLSALTTYLNGGLPVFMFNNNQVNSGASTNQELFAWAQISIVDLQGQLQTLYYDFTAMTPNHGGIPNGDVTTYTSPGAATGTYPVGANAGWPIVDNFVRSGGAICILAGNIVPCGTPGAITINHNLGADRATYAVIFPELNAILYDLEGMGYDLFRFDFRMGCNPQYVSDCTGQELNNGYEQLFLVAARPPVYVPEPATVGLLGLGLLGLGLARRRQRG